MPELQRVVARLFRAALWGGATCIIVAGGLDVVGWTTVAHPVGLVGIGIVVAAPFVILIGVVIVGRRSAAAAWALASLVITALGYVLAR